MTSPPLQAPPQLRTYPDVEDLLVTVLDAWWPGRVGSQRPTDLKAALDGGGVFVEAQRYGGTDDGLTDRPTVEVAVYAATHATGTATAGQLREHLSRAPHVIGSPPTQKVIDAVTTLLGPQEVPYGDSGVRKWVARYRVSCRRT